MENLNRETTKKENSEERLTTLEIKMSYLEDFLMQVQSVAVEQGEIIERLKTENRLMKDKIKEMSDLLEGDIPNVRPPHY